MDDSTKRKNSVDELSRSSEPILESKDGLDSLYQETTIKTDVIALGTILSERYEVLEFLGSGGMGTVYKARHTLIGNVVAIKVMHSHLVKDFASQERFKSEAKAAISLRHERLMSVTDYGLTPSGQPFIVMEFIQGVSLDALLEEQKFLSADEFFDIFSQICDGLAHVHERGVVHRDIKPSNIMLSKTAHDKWMVHIVDFGIAKVLPSGQGAVQHLTQTGEIFGSPLYMSPEQCKGRVVDARSDIYSLGCVMFEALTGSPPHRGESAIETLMFHVNAKAPKLSERRPDIGECAELDKIVAAALDAAPDLRYQTIGKLKADLDQRKFSDIGASTTSGATSFASSSRGSSANQTSFSPAQNFKNKFLSPLIIVAAAGLTVWLVNSFGVTQPRVAIVSGASDPSLSEAEMAFRLAKDKDAQGFTLEAAEIAQKALDLRLKYAPNTLALAESMNQRAEIALHDAEHESLMLQGQDVVSPADKSAARRKKIADDYASAETLLKSAIAIADLRTTGEEKAVAPVRFRNNLATAYLDQGKFQDAETSLNELSQLFLTHRAPDKNDPDSVQRNLHALFDEQYERLYWGTNREVDAANLRIAHHRTEGKYDQAAPISNTAEPFTGSWSAGTFSLDLKQDGKALAGDNQITNFGLEQTTERKNRVTGTVDGNIAHLTCSSATHKDQQINAVAVRIANVLVLHVIHSSSVMEEGYVPDNAILDLTPAQAETPEVTPAPAAPPPTSTPPTSTPASPPPNKETDSPAAVES
ncbi:hypothetical protein BH10CYA1_BH10CYA1_38040 [soil metagenome]